MLTEQNTIHQIKLLFGYFLQMENQQLTQVHAVVLGTAYRNTSFVIYEQTVQGLSDSPFEPNRSCIRNNSNYA